MNILQKFKWLSIGAFIAWVILPLVVYAANVTVPQALQKGGWLSGLANGNYQTNAPCSNGLVLIASSTTSSGWTCASPSGSTGLVSLQGMTGPAITVSTGTDANIGLNITTGGNNATFTPTFIGQLSIARGGTGSSSLNTTLVTEGNNLYFTNTRAAGAISLTTTGTSGASTYNTSTGALNIPQYQSAGTYVTSVTGSGNISSSGGITPNITFTGILPVSNGGTGAANLTSGDILFGNGISAVATSSGFTFSSNILTAPAITLSNLTGTQCLHEINGVVSGTGSDCGSGGSGITALTGDVTATGTGSATATLATVNGNVGSFVNANITVNAKGLITAASNGSSGSGTVSGGSTGFVTTWASSTGLTFGILRDNGTVAGVNATSSTVSFNVQGSGTLNPFNVASSSGTSLLTVAANGSTTISSLAVAGNVQTTATGALYVNGQTGTGLNVLQNSPTLVTPILGNASATALTLSGNLYTNAINCPNIQTNVAGLVACNNTSYQPLLTFPLSYASSTATTTTSIYGDVNRGDTYTANGSIVFPYKSIASMIAASSTLGNSYNLAPGTYVSGAPDTWQQSSFALQGNEATYIPVSGVTLPGSFDIYDLNIQGCTNVTESDNSLTFIHQFANGTIGCNLTTAGLATLSGEVLTSTTSVWTALAGSLNSFQNGESFEKIINNGILNFQGAEENASTSGYAIISTSTGSSVHIISANVLNTDGGVNINNGATSSPNVLLDMGVFAGTSTPIGMVNAGNSSTQLCNFLGINTLTGQVVGASGTNWLPCIDGVMTVQATTSLASDGRDMVMIGTSTPDSTFIRGQTQLGIVASSTLNNYSEVNYKCKNSGSLASIDYVLTSNIGSSSSYFTDLFQNCSGFVNTSPTSGTANDSGLINNDASIIIGTASSTNANAHINFVDEGTNVATTTSSGLIVNNLTVNGTCTNCGGGGGISGGTNGQNVYWTGATTIGSSSDLFDNGTVSGVNATSSTSNFTVQGTGTNNSFTVSSSSTNSLFTVLANNSVQLSMNAASTFSSSTVGSSAAVLKLGSLPLVGGNGNGTVFAINESGAADFLNFENAGSSQAKITSSGAISGISISGGNASLSNNFLSNSNTTTFTIRSALANNAGYDMTMLDNNVNRTIGATVVQSGILNLNGTNFNPTTGGAAFNSLQIANSFTQTSTAIGTTRGLFINPSLLGVYDYRNFEIAATTTTLTSQDNISTAYNVLFNPLTYSSASSVQFTLANASTLNIAGVPNGTTASTTIASSTGITIAGNALTNVTNGFGLYVTAPTGATNNYAAWFNGNFVLNNSLFSFTQSTAPGLSCGGGCAFVGTGTDAAGRVRVGTGGVTNGTITWSGTHTTTPICTVDDEQGGGTQVTGSATPTTLVFTSTGSLTAHNITYICVQTTP